MTGDWSVDGFVDAIYERQTDIVDLYLQSGMSPTTLADDASAILWGYQGDMNGDPVALLDTFREHGFDVDEHLTDGRILSSMGEGLPWPFDTELTPDGYTGGYQDGVFKGPLLFWIVSRASWIGVSDQDREVIEYLIDNGADCSIPYSFLESSRDLLSGTSAYDELFPMIEECVS
jgi:hypothetical protein